MNTKKTNSEMVDLTPNSSAIALNVNLSIKRQKIFRLDYNYNTLLTLVTS